MGTRGQVAKLPGKLHPARRQKTGRECEVVVRSEIEIVRNLELEAVASGMTEAREQQTTLTLVTQRKRNIRRVKNRHAFETHDHAACDAFFSLGVEVDRGRLQHPILVAHRARGVAHLGQDHIAIGMRIDVFGEPSSVAVQELEVGLVEIGGAVGVVTAGIAANA